MLLRFLIHFCVFFNASRSQSHLQERQGRYDITHSGRYTIVNCGSSNAAVLVSLLDDLWILLQPSISDAALTVPSPAFDTFFRSVNSAAYVEQLLRNVTAGIALYPPAQKFHQTGSPLLICVTSGEEVVGQRSGIDYYYQCLLNPDDTFSIIRGTPYIVVCPNLFSSSVADVPPARTCLPVDTDRNRFFERGQYFANFKVWKLLESILRYYLYATVGSSVDFAREVNRCVMLRAGRMVRNPSNYVYYAASIYGQCTEFPYIPVPRRRPLENSTLLTNVTHESDGGDPNGTSLLNFAVSD